MTPIPKKYGDVIGLDISPLSVKLVWLRKSGLSCELLGSAVKAMPVKEAAEFLKDKAPVVQAVRSAVNELGCTAKKAFLYLEEPRVCIKRVSVVSMPKEELKEAVKLAVKDSVPLDLDKALIDYQILEETKDEQGTGHMHILLAVADKGFILRCVDIIRSAGLLPAGINLSPFALQVFLQTPSAESQEVPSTSAILNIGNSKVEFIIFKDAVPQFTRLLPGSGEDFTRSMTGALVSDQGRLELTYEQAEQLKKDVGIPGQESGSLKEGISAGQLLSMLRPVAEKLASEIRRSFDYCRFQLKIEPPARIYLAGGGSLLKGLDAFLSNALSVEVQRLDVLHARFIQAAGLGFAGDAALFSGALAVALEENIHINLLPPELKAEKMQSIQKTSLKFATLVSVLLLSSSFFYMIMQSYTLHRQIKLARKNYDVIHEVALIKEKIDRKAALVRDLAAGRRKAADILRVLSVIVPPPVELDSFACRDKGEVDIKGTVLGSQPEVAVVNFIKSLHDAELFEDIKIAYLGRESGKENLYGFIISCKVKY